MSEVRKISVPIPPVVVDKITLAAASTGVSVSAWLPSAAMRQLDEQARLEIGRIEAAARVADHEAEHGPIRPEVTADVERFFEEIRAANSEGGSYRRHAG